MPRSWSCPWSIRAARPDGAPIYVIEAHFGPLRQFTIANTNTVIFCGHFPAGAESFTEDEIEGESRGQWYVRQALGSANSDGGPLLHILTGNLSHQIEHHLFPDLPSNRYAQIAPRVRMLCEKCAIPYTTGPLLRQYASTWARIWRMAIP
ncbi:hypothetical protein GCM10027072_78190 [Streptomyces bullii]